MPIVTAFSGGQGVSMGIPNAESCVFSHLSIVTSIIFSAHQYALGAHGPLVYLLSFTGAHLVGTSHYIPETPCKTCHIGDGQTQSYSHRSLASQNCSDSYACPVLLLPTSFTANNNNNNNMMQRPIHIKFFIARDKIQLTTLAM